MNLLRCHILGFGKLANLPLSFERGLNVVFAANEGGKSTLQRFLMALLYGQLRPDVKAQRRLDAWVEQYKPWRAPDYGGTLWCELASGRELELYRTFGREESRFEVRTSGGEDISRQYEAQRNGDLLFAATHLGLSKELFESIAVIRETETAVLPHREPLRDRIANLAQSGDEKLSVRLSLVKLEEALEAIGSERAPTKPYKQALDRLQALQEEKVELDARRSQCQAWTHERQELGNEIKKLERALHAAARAVLEARFREAQLQVRTLLEIDTDVLNLENEIQTLGADPEFPVHQLEALNRLAADKDNADRRLEELRIQKQEAESRGEQCAAELRKLADYGVLHESVEPEKITEWFVRYLSLSRQRDDVQRAAHNLMDEANALEHRILALSPVLQKAEIDWERKARQAAEEQHAATQKSMALAESVALGKAERERDSKIARRQGVLAALALLGALAAAFAGLLRYEYGLGAAAGLAVLCAGLSVMALRSRSSAERSRLALEVVEDKLAELRDQAQSAQNELQRAATESGFSSIEDFLAAARQTTLDRQRLVDMAPRIQEAEEQCARLQLDADEIFAHLKECLTRAGINCAPGNLKAPVDTLRVNMRRYAELLANQRRLAQDGDALRTDEVSVAARASQIGASIQAVLAEGGVNSPDEFRKGCQDCLRLREISAKKASRVREFERMRGAFTLEQWRARLEELQASRGDQNAEPGEHEESTRPRPYLPYLPTVEETEREERRLADLLAGKKEVYAGLVERVRQAFHNYRSPAELEEDLGGAERAVQHLTLNRKALNLALEGIQSLARLQQEVCAPQLNRAVEDRFLQICPDRYEEVKIDPDFRVQAREKSTAELRPAESLSRGTQDQLYFAVRFGVLDLLGNTQEPCPCLLDEPFTAYDGERMCAAFRILQQETSRRQLILFTCREDIRELAPQYGAHVISL